MSLPARRIAGVVLAGGMSRRMFREQGQGDKGLLPLGDNTMLGHVIERLAPQVEMMALNANGDPARFARFRLPVLPDTIDGGVGPLAGVLSGLRWAAANGATHIATVSGDAPFIPHDLVARLSAAVAPGTTAIAIARSGGELHPVIGVWPVTLAADLDASLRSGVRKVLAWTDRHGTVPVDFPMIETSEGPLDPFFNANTPEDLAEARRLISTRRS
ncbi:MAG: molybdenum cofactor guanylyltransferase MobA [Gammaproteobacteria bacterium]|nr:molybdenum cofactor guanylyltransferase MobA [Gammaproteobacteria bacterium]